MTPRPFLPNGCSRSPDGTWKSCCDVHDLAYYVGGSLLDKARTDAGLALCMGENLTSIALARDRAQPWWKRALAALAVPIAPPLYFLGVTALGWTPWHWSYTRKPVPTPEELAALEGVDRAALEELAEALRNRPAVCPLCQMHDVPPRG